MRTERELIDTAGAPAAIGPCGQAVLCDGLLLCSGQIPLDPSSGELARAIKVTVYLRDMPDFAAVNEVCARFFPLDPPARAATAVAGLPGDARVEIEALVAAGGVVPSAIRGCGSASSPSVPWLGRHRAHPTLPWLATRLDKARCRCSRGSH